MNKSQREGKAPTGDRTITQNVVRRNLERYKSEPILQMGERSVDLSNLCLSEAEAHNTIPTRVLRRQQTMPPKRNSIHYLFDGPLYPSREEFSSVSLPSTEEVFCEPKTSLRSKETQLKPRQDKTEQRVGAFRETLKKQYPEKSKPPPPTWVDSPNRKPAAKPTPLSEQVSRHEVEVAPGKYMPLRGAVETMAAVNNGTSRLVGCLACQTRLRCVPDAELVICPDCRVLSPVLVCADDEADWSSSGSECEDDALLRYPPDVRRFDRVNKIFKSKEWVGGVGLGFKVEFQC